MRPFCAFVSLWFLARSARVRFKPDLHLHKRHTFRNDGQGNEPISQKLPHVIHNFMIDTVDAQAQAVYAFFQHQFAFQGPDFFDEVIELFQKRAVVEFGPYSDNRVAGQPAPLVACVEDFEVAALDFDDQPQFLRELKLVSIILGPAIDEVTDVDWTGLQAYCAVCTAQTN